MEVIGRATTVSDRVAAQEEGEEIHVDEGLDDGAVVNGGVTSDPSCGVRN